MNYFLCQKKSRRVKVKFCGIVSDNQAGTEWIRRRCWIDELMIREAVEGR